MNNLKDDRLFFEFILLKGLKKIGKEGNKRYTERLKYEFDRMVGKKYINYFLCNWDFVNAAKKKGISVGNCRGSAGSSLVAYCLDITDIDPIEHDLLFTRFLSPIRKDAPDIDLDFQDNRRQEVYDYLMEKYGRTHCAKVATYSHFHPKGLLLDIGRIFNIPRTEIAKISSLVIERCISGDSKVFLQCGKEMKISKLYELYKGRENKQVKAIKEYGISFFMNKKAFHQQAIKKVSYAGKKQMFLIKTELGKEIEASEDHRFFTRTGWKKLKELKVEDEIMTFHEKEDYVKCKVCGKVQTHLGKHNMDKKQYKTKDVSDLIKRKRIARRKNTNV